MKFVTTKKGLTTNFFSPLSFVAVFGSAIRNPGWVKIRIRDKHPGSATMDTYLILTYVILVPCCSYYVLGTVIISKKTNKTWPTLANKSKNIRFCVSGSVPYVFGSPGSGSVIICTDPDPSINKQK